MMLVKTHRNGNDRTGLHIGRANANRFFRKDAHSIELKLGDLHIRCTLAPDFWEGRPQIQDPRLSEWLKFKVGRARSGPGAALLTLVPAGVDTFVLHPSSEAASEAFGAEISAPTKAPPQSCFPPVSVAVLQSRSVA
jgi:hypothetical protein